MKLKLTEREIEIINSAIDEYGLNLGTKITSCDQLMSMEKRKIWDLVNNGLSCLIGYDKKKGDIDDLGAEADEIIGKLLIMLRERGDFDYDD